MNNKLNRRTHNKLLATRISGEWPMLSSEMVRGERQGTRLSAVRWFDWTGRFSPISPVWTAGLDSGLATFSIFKIPGVAGAVLHTPLSLINSLGRSSFVEISSSNLHSQTVRARKLNFWEKVHLPPTCHVSCVMCHMSLHSPEPPWHYLTLSDT